MSKGILGKKVGMTQVFDSEGRAVPATVIEAGPCVVVQKKTKGTDGYEAIQLGFEDRRELLVNKPEKGHFQKAGVKPKHCLREFEVEDAGKYQVGEVISADIFREGELVDVVGTSKGKGFAGVIKRWHFSRGPMSHGSMYHRRPGSLGATAPARVFKGRKLPGRLGGKRVTVQNLRVVKVDPGRNILLVEGAVPGVRGGLVTVKTAVKA